MAMKLKCVCQMLEQWHLDVADHSVPLRQEVLQVFEHFISVKLAEYKLTISVKIFTLSV